MATHGCNKSDTATFSTAGVSNTSTKSTKRRPTDEEITAIMNQYPDITKDVATGIAQNRINKGQNITTGASTIPNVPAYLTENGTLPTDILNSPQYKSLTQEQKDLVALTYNTTKVKDEQTRKLAQESLNEAIKLVDPFYKEQIRTAQDEIQRAISGTQADAKSSLDQLNTRIKQINEDLIYNKDQLTIEQQSELSQQLQDYQVQLEDLRQNYAEAGLAFSSPRDVAEQRLSMSQTGLAESSNRKYQRAVREQDVTAERQLQQSAQQIADTQRQSQERTTDIYRQGEKALGSKNLPTTDSATALGGITGSIEEDRQNAILGLQNTLLNSKLPISTTGLLNY